MKRFAIVAAALAACLSSFAQSAQDFKDRYERQVRMLGLSGVGVETILDRWEAAFPEDGDMLEARFNFYTSKAASSSVVEKDSPRYLGNKPMVSLKDSLGRNVNYFEVTEYVDSLFSRGQSAISRAISLYPQELVYRIDKITSLMAYEKESPDLAYAELERMIDLHASSHPVWTYGGGTASEEDFISIVQEYCHGFYSIDTPNGYEFFRMASEKMNRLYPRNSMFVSNLGSYWFVGKGNLKKALSCYRKALKINPDDEAAAKNIKILEKKMAAAKK